MKPRAEIPAANEAPMSARARLVLFAACAAIALAAFSPALMSEAFVGDADSPLRLSLVSHVKHVPTLFGGDFMVSTNGQYRPLGYALLATVRTLVPADWSPFWRAWLVAFHAINAALVYAIARRFVRSRLAAAAACGVFLLHPLATVVACHMGRFHQLLGTTLFLTTLLLYLEFARTGRWALYAWMLPLFAAGLLTTKAVATLPVALAIYELGVRRAGVLAAARRLAPFAALVALMVPCWTLIAPNPLYYIYPTFAPGVGWYSFASVVAAAPRMAAGFLGGWGVPAPLSELTARLTVAMHWRFLVAFAPLVALIVAAAWGLKRHWVGFAFLLIPVALIPYSTTALNCTEEFVAWDTLYLPLAAFALVAGATADALLASLSAGARRFASALVAVMLAMLGAVQVMDAAATRSASEYWARVLTMNRQSEIASVALGRARLAGGNEEEGFRLLFSANVTRLAPSSAIAARWYASQGETLAAALHLRFCIDAPGATYDEVNETIAALAQTTRAMGALDWTEDSLAQIVTRNPYEAETQTVLAALLADKGYTRAAARMMRRACELEPGRADFRSALEKIERRRFAPASAPAVVVVTPQPPEQLQYAIGRPVSVRLRASLLQLADVHEYDPVVQFEAGLQFMQDGRKALAFDRLIAASDQLQRYPYAWAARCWIAREMGRDDVAISAALRVLRLGPLDAFLRQNIYHNLGFLAGRQGLPSESAAYYRMALEVKGDSAEAHNGLAGALLRMGKFEEALQHLDRAADLGLQTANLHNNAGFAMLRLGRPAEALAHFRRAVDLDPQDVRTHRALASALLSMGSFAQSRAAYARGLERFPDDDELAMGMSLILSAAPEEDLRDGPRAVRLMEGIVRKGQSPPAELLDVLAAAYAESGRFADARATARQALAAAGRQGKSAFIRDIEGRLRLYDQGKPYRLGPAGR